MRWRVEQRGFADRLGLGRLGRVELVGLVFQLFVQALRDVDHLLELVHRLPQAGTLGVDRRIVHQQLVLAVGEAGENLRDVGLRAAILVEVAVDAIAEWNDSEQLARLAGALRIERFDRTSELRQVGADAAVLVDCLDRAIEEAVGGAGRLGDFLAAHRRQLVDLLAELGAVAVEGGKLLDELLDTLVELADFLVLERNQAGGLGRCDRLKRFRRVELELALGLRGCLGHLFMPFPCSRRVGSRVNGGPCACKSI